MDRYRLPLTHGMGDSSVDIKPFPLQYVPIALQEYPYDKGLRDPQICLVMSGAESLIL
jgi:hypothetical protein